MNRTRLASIVVTAIACLAIAPAWAHASRVTIRPSGAVTEASEGKVRFRFEGRTIECNQTLAGTLNETAEGTLTGAPEPATNPNIGTITEGGTSGCTGGVVVVLSGRHLKYVYGQVEGHPEQWAMYTLDYEILAEDGMSLRCLYKVRMDWIYETGTGKLITRAVTELIMPRRLTILASCPIRIQITGTFNVETGGRTFPTLALS